MEKKQLITIGILGLLIVLALAFSIMNFTMEKEEERTEYRFKDIVQEEEINQSAVNESIDDMEVLNEQLVNMFPIIIMIAVIGIVIGTLFSIFNRNGSIIF